MITSVDRLIFVRSISIFSQLRDDFLVRLASAMDELAFPEGHTIFTHGQEGQSLYIIVEGRVKVHIGDRILAELGKGKCFGEMAVFDSEPRSASVTTLEYCECLMLTQQQLYEAIEETPGIAVNIIRLLSRRIRELNQQNNAAASPATQPAPIAEAPSPNGQSHPVLSNRAWNTRAVRRLNPGTSRS
jgi:CRP/FNR family cyclic AMP-dependent transcriptional regulator